ncbi:hypothetical protein [Cellulomonas dongxiuzhuiae]|uniref:Uncharacterized protein n=1 Tax=Cellulomonas dongxiuzhuiae TaxID=2819979 RepID=A0ABX8GKG8_9CELL|nr:hypothetical protein [Cellulomonas dongxiuzhuiae]MBO3095469.1 hypothetical protein [Cellulomonas dongxiuzhuiae]QWC16450.1 hypothetical protein KKR89_01875 [Cellulomonas dongxiuzhuiae]
MPSPSEVEMALCVPRIVGPVSGWTSSLLIEGAVAGATVVVRDGSPTGPDLVKSSVGGGRDRVPLLPGVQLSPGRALFVAQIDAFDTSPWTSPHLAEVVGPPPVDWAKVPPPWFRSQVFACGRAVWVEGCVPGAQVSISVGALPLGQAVADEGRARARLGTGFPAGLVARATLSAPPGAPGIVGAPVSTTTPVRALPVPSGAELPAVVVGPPRPEGCDTSIVVAGVVDGAEVTVDRADEGIVEVALFDLDSLSLRLGTPLDPRGGRLTVAQAVSARCEVRPSPPVTVEWGPATQPPTPTPRPPCGGSPFLYVENLKGGAALTIDVGGTVFRTVVPPATTATVFEVAPMAEGVTVSVTQQACGLASQPGVTTVGPGMVSQPPTVAGPLLRCARVVRVTGVTPGALVRVHARGVAGSSPISPWVWTGSTSVAIEVSPSLVEDDEVSAEQTVCGGGPVTSDRPEVVQALPDLLPVEIAFAFATQRSVTVVALPGALVRVFRRVTGEEIGWGLVDPENDRVRVDAPLVEGEVLFAVQHLCNQRSEDGPDHRVRPGRRTFLLPQPKTWPVTSEPVGHDVTWRECALECRIDGVYTLRGLFENTAEGSSADIDASVRLTHPSGWQLERTMTLLLAADNDSNASNDLLKQKGYTSMVDRTWPGLEPTFRRPDVWSLVLDATATFQWLVALSTFPESEADDVDEDKDPPPPSP